MSKPNSVYAKIAKIAAMGASKKDGKMTAVGKYNYHTIDGVLDHLRPLLAENDLVVNYSVIEGDVAAQGGYFNVTKWIEVTITDTETGDQVTGKELAIGIDKNDKGPGKATSYALKTFLVATFALKGLPDENTQPVVMNQATAPARKSGGTVDKVTAERIRSRVHQLGVDVAKFLSFAGADKFETISPAMVEELDRMLDTKEKVTG